MAGERSDLGKIFITDGGIYDANTTYEKLTMVSYNNSTYITLRTVTGVTPSNDRINYGLMAQGFTATYLSSVTAEDVQGLVVEAGSETPAQSLINAIADRVANQLVSNSDLQDILSDYILKSAIANNLSITEEGKVLDARQGKALNDAKVSKTELNTVDAKHSNYSTAEFSRIAYYQDRFTFRKIGRFVELSYAGASVAQSAQSTYVELGTLPDAFKPLGFVYIMMTPANSSGANSTVIQITPDGKINTYNFNKAVAAGVQYRIQTFYNAKDYSTYSG